MWGGAATRNDMSVCNVVLLSMDGVAVTIPAATAWEQIGLLRGLEALDEGGCGAMPPVELDFSASVVQAVANYLENPNRRLVEIPIPLTASVEHFVKPWEMEFVRDIEKRVLLLPLLECATYLRIDALQSLLSAYLAQRICEISKSAPCIMEGAEQLRQYLHLENEWTPEERVQLGEEMQYVKILDPSAY